MRMFRCFLLASLCALPLLAALATPAVAGVGDPGAAEPGHNAAPHDVRMSPLQAVILGVVEGLTEYLPVSSTGHLLLTQRLMGLDDTARAGEAANAYAICIQAGAILAVAGLYLGYLRRMARGLLGRDPVGLRLGLCVGIAFVPAAVAGLLLETWIKDQLFGAGKLGFWPLAAAWIGGGVLILLMDSRLRARRQSNGGLSLDQLTGRLALGIGLAQCVAMWPGVSRSLATILGGLAVGLSMTAAVEFSFLLGLLTLSASTALSALKYGSIMLDVYGWTTPLIGLVAAFVSAAAAVTWLVRYLQRHPMTLFGWYRIALGLTVAAWLWIRPA